jgi:hypothetical protein
MVRKYSIVGALWLVFLSTAGPAGVWSNEPPILGGSVFIDRPSRTPCFVVGEVSWPKEEMEPKTRLLTWCPIHVQRDGKYILLSSSRWRVEIAIPEDPHPQGFLYVWGQPAATIGSRSVNVAYGPVDGV